MKSSSALFLVSVINLLLPFSSALAVELSPEAKLLKDLVSISSGTATVSGVEAVQEKVAAKLKALGFEVEMKANPIAGNLNAKQLIATRKGKKSEFITLIGHADTVFEKLNPFEISEDGKIIKGSGVADNKGGLVVGVTALQKLLEKGQSNYSLRFVSSPSEETGSVGFHESFKKIAQESKVILGLEPSRENGAIVKSRKGSMWISVKVSGKESHAGVDHQKGVNACHELAIKVDQLQKLTNYKKGLTVSIGHIEGGKDKYNIVCGEAMAKIDARFPDVKTQDEALMKMKKILEKVNVKSAEGNTPSQTEFSLTEGSPPFHLSKKTEPYLQKYLNIVNKIEGKPSFAESTGGAGDVNFMDVGDVVIIDGLGPIGGAYHTNAEYVNAESLQTRSEALYKFLNDLNAFD